jgi:undecaprenyl-diphosphatase
MTIFQAIILGIVQGLTEFIPVSSSGHLVLVPWLLGWRFEPEIVFVFDVLVQLGTLVAVFVYFWDDILTMTRAVLLGLRHGRPFETAAARLGWLVALATLPAVVLGVLLKDLVEATFHSEVATAGFLLGTAALLALSESMGRRTRGIGSLNWVDAAVIGLTQALAVFPGISRSGATIAGGLWRGLERTAAARFSFLMSIPAMLGAGVIAARDLAGIPNFASYLPPILAGFVAAAIVGYLCIRWLLAYLQRGSLYVFAAYCLVAALVSLLVAWLRA